MGVYPILLFDGDSAFCTASGNVLTRYIRPRVQIIAWRRADLTALGVSTQECRESRACQESIQWFGGPGSSPLTQGRAVAAAPAPLTVADTMPESAQSGAAAWSGAPASASLAA